MTEKPVVLFDGICNFCNNAVNFAIRHDYRNQLLFCPMQSSKGQELLQQHGLPLIDFKTFILVDDGRIYTKSSAAIRLCRYFRVGWQLNAIWWIFPKWLRDIPYTILANNRYKWFGKKESCMIPSPELRAKFLI